MQGLIKLFIFVAFYFFQEETEALVEVQDLGGSQWNAAGIKPPSSLVQFLPVATVPGCIHTDWFNNSKTQKQEFIDPYYRFNDVELRTIAEHNWKYKRNFEVSKTLLGRKEQWLVFEGLDTVAAVFLNNRLLGNTRNMFLKHIFNVTGLLQENFNQITVAFESALTAANTTRKTLNYTIPPECPPDVQHGFCHVNLLRKEQCSFSWDWGPGFATQGIWKPVYILALDEAVMSDANVIYDWDSEVLLVQARFRVTGERNIVHNGMLAVYIEELHVNQKFNVSILSSSSNQNHTFKIHIPAKILTVWWPSGQGSQKLYNITLHFLSETGSDVSNKTIWFGFRKVELIQEPIPGSSGLSFYFKINDRPIFAKGSNWIPADSFKNRLTRSNYTNLLQSAKDANMNMLRVWGGGIYESDIFYEIADQLGIMIWQDFMFACAMYPADLGFLASVSEEVNETMWRLTSHASIVIWAGNNENEAALGTNWYNTTSKFDMYKSDYVKLYINTIGNIVSSMDNSRPFLSSSPTNGAESQTEGWVAKNPYDTHNGDVHYYNYNDDCLDWTKYPKTRFASEYGFQSWPSLETLKPVTIAEDLAWESNFSKHRQHHANGNQQMLNQISMHFKLPNSGNAAGDFQDMVYLSQLMQALCYKSETEFYRRSRSEIVKGEGDTMGALYWQLNDIWQAPTWSSIEYEGKWKAVHYFAKQFYSSVALVAFDDDSIMTIYSVSDENTPIEPVTLVIEMRQWSSFGVISTWTQPLYIPPQASKLQYQNSTGTMLHYGGCGYKELCYFTIRLQEMEEVPATYFFPVYFKDIDGLSSAAITVTSVKFNGERKMQPGVLEKSYAYTVSLSTSAPAVFVWLEATGINGRFSDNAFIFYETTKNISFYSLDNVSAEMLKMSIEIRSLSDVKSKASNMGAPGRIEEVRSWSPLISDFTFEREIYPTMQEVFWLDDMRAQLAFGICGVLFIMFFATLLVCVVMRFNSPSLDKPPSLLIASQYVPPKSPVEKLCDASKESKSSTNTDDDESGAFLIRMKQGYGHNAKKMEVHFYVT